MVTVRVDVNVEVSDDEILDMIDTAGYGIRYWCERGIVDENTRQYTVTLNSEARENDYSLAHNYVINFDDIVRVLVEVATGKHDVGYPRQYAQAWLSDMVEHDHSAGHLDTEIMDCVIQLCAFGEVLFG